MEHSAVDSIRLLWAAGWLIAVLVLFVLALRVPLQPGVSRLRSLLLNGGVVVAALAVVVLANMALSLHDVHFDATYEKVYTPAAEALAVVDKLDRPVSLTYLYQGQDPQGSRMREMAELMGRRNPLLKVLTIDPDKKPSLAETFGVKVYNAAVLEADGRRIVVPTTDETQVAIGIQRVLRQRVVTLCFIEGHNEYPVDSFEFHTHLEGLHDHAHGDAASKVVETTGHGIGRLRRALEALGYEIRRVTPATQGIPADCAMVVVANPRNTFLPDESSALEKYLQQGGAAMLLFDLGFVFEPRLQALLQRLGVQMAQSVIIDEREHYATDPEMVAVTSYEPHPVTKSVSLTFFPGARPLILGKPAEGLTVTPIVVSGRDSISRPVALADVRQVAQAAAQAADPDQAEKRPRVIVAAVEGKLGAGTTRVIVSGDADFASNSFLPYMANSDLALSMVRWLVREENLAPVSSRIPVPPMVLLTKPQMQLIFVLVEILLPFAVFAVGCIMWYRRR